MKQNAPCVTWKRKVSKMLFQKSPNPGEDINRFLQIVPERRKMIDEASTEPLPVTYKVNTLAKALHPGYIAARITSIRAETHDVRTFTLAPTGDGLAFPYFRAGQFVTLTAQIGDSRLTRAYSLSSSPKQALAGIYEVTVRRAGFFSDWLFDQAMVGTELTVGEPSGDFYHDDLRDLETVVAVAGGSGITPFRSMIRAILEGSEDFNLILIYGTRTRSDIIFENEFENIVDERIQMVTVLSDEKVEGFENGFITADLLKKYVPERASFFLCGPDAMYHFVDAELAKLGITGKFVRQEHNAVADRKISNPREFVLNVRIRDQKYSIPANENETLVVSMERAGLAAPSRCRSGICGFCHSKLISGAYFVPEEHEYRRAADFKFGFIHPCCTFPDSDMEIDVPVDTTGLGE